MLRPFAESAPTPAAIKSGSRDQNRRDVLSNAAGAWDVDARTAWHSGLPPPVLAAALEAAAVADAEKKKSVMHAASTAAALIIL